jgi:TRAP-type transport system small permease protein
MNDPRPGAARDASGNLLARACALAEHLAIAMLLLTTLFIVMQVAARNFMNAGLPWAEELARYCGLGIVFLSIPRLLLEGRHITVGLVVERLRGLSERVARLLIEALNLAFCGLFLYAGFVFLQRAGKFTTPALSMPNTLFYLPAAVGMALLTAVAAYRLLRFIRAWSEGEPPIRPAGGVEESAP